MDFFQAYPTKYSKKKPIQLCKTFVDIYSIYPYVCDFKKGK